MGNPGFVDWLDVAAIVPGNTMFLEIVRSEVTLYLVHGSHPVGLDDVGRNLEGAALDAALDADLDHIDGLNQQKRGIIVGAMDLYARQRAMFLPMRPCCHACIHPCTTNRAGGVLVGWVALARRAFIRLCMHACMHA